MDTLRTSSYVIPVRLENENGKYMLIHGYTGAMDIVSEGLLAKINSVSSGADLSEQTLSALQKRGYVTTKTKEEEYDYVARIAKSMQKKWDVLHTTFTWIVSYNCNFRCPYCYEGRDTKDGKYKLTFTKEQVDIAYDAQDKIQPHKELRKRTITLYGGEPLLAENKEIVNYIVEEGRKRGYIFLAVTNGYEVDHFLNLLSPDGIYKLQITIDGTKEIHNLRRPHCKDDNTFDKIVDNVEQALKKGIQVSVRMNSDKKNINDYTALKNIFQDRNFFDYPDFKFYLGRIRDNGYITSSEHKDLDFIPVQSFVEKQEQLGVTPFKQDSGIYRNIYNALINKQSLPFNSIVCSAQSNGNVLDPFGNIYPCWEVINNKDCVKGNYSKEGVTWNNKVVNEWKTTGVSHRMPCSHCKYALLCGGGCPHYRKSSDYNICLLFKKIFPLVVNKAYAESNIV
jgi:uncharacterized protein